jgi:hypothetical protein
MTENNGLKRTVELRAQLERCVQDLGAMMDEYRQGIAKLGDELHAKSEAARAAGKSSDKVTADYNRDASQVRQTYLEKSSEKQAEVDKIVNELKIVQTEAGIEGTKLRVEALKHQATLSAAAVAGVTAITASSAMPKDASHLYLFWITLAILLMTIVLSLFSIYMESSNIEYVLKTGQERAKYHRARAILTRLLYVSVLGLPTAIVLFIIFAVQNVLR